GPQTRRLDTELASLGSALSETLLSERGIGLTLHCDEIVLDARRSWQMCLIISELVMNAVRHAFGEADRGEIFVDIRQSGPNLRCIVSDNGSASVAPSPGGGTTIVDGLVNDLNGRVSRAFTSAGSAVCVMFPLDSDAAASARFIP